MDRRKEIGIIEDEKAKRQIYDFDDMKLLLC
jgi:hypothetical protein